MTGSAIAGVRARQVWDSRGFPTVEVDVELEDGSFGRAIAPAGASCGSGEAIDLRDGSGPLGGKGVRCVLAAIDEVVSPALRGLDASDQRAIDDALAHVDGTTNFARIGGNGAVASSLATLHAAAASTGLPLWRYIAETHGIVPTMPLPEVQIFGGGAHAARRVDVQDFMIMVPGAESFADAMSITAAVYHAAGACMEDAGKRAGVADEGGWWPAFDTNEAALDMLMRAIERAGEVPGDRVVISLDIAATQFRVADGYCMALDGETLDDDALIARIGGWLDRYPIVAIEDPMAEDSHNGFRAFQSAYGDRVQLVGDDYLVTDAGRIEAAARAGTCNTALIKVNQAGTVSRATAALHAARAAGWSSIVSARSGESEDVSIVHLAVGLASNQLKVGSFARSERMAKWNECLRIEEELGADAFVRGAPLAATWWAPK